MLFLVLGLLMLVLYLVKRFMTARNTVSGEVSLRVVSTLHLSPKERVEVIEISGEKIALGVSPGRINYLTRLKDGAEKVQN
jgi:flagellar protein FliO/FliZ